MAQCPGSTQGVKALFPMEFDPEQGYYIAQTSSYRSGQGHAYSLQKWFVLVKASAGSIVRAEYAIGSHGPPRTDPVGNNLRSTHRHPSSTSVFHLPFSMFHPSPYPAKPRWSTSLPSSPPIPLLNHSPIPLLILQLSK